MRANLNQTFYPILVIYFLFFGCNKPNVVESEIIQLRLASNQALKSHDLETLSSHWTNDFILISSRGNVYNGKQENVTSYQEMFEQSPDEWYERTPDRVMVLDGWSIATEQGTWKGEFTQTGSTYRVNGTYMAKWIKMGDNWKLQSEYYAPVSCTGGAFCEETPEKPFAFRFHHTALYVSDMAKSLDFYLHVPGLTIDQRIDTLIDIANDGSRSPRPISITFLKFKNGQHILELIETTAAEGASSSTYQHVGIAVDDVHEVWQHMLNAGAVPRREPGALIANGAEVSIAFFTGPDGEIVELMEWK